MKIENAGARMRVAIIIGIDTYQSDDIQNLPACANDANLFHQLVKLTGRFDEVFVLSSGQGQTSQSIKSRLASFLEPLQEHSIEEALLFFSGHGLIHDDQFRYVLPDFDHNAINKTTISNQSLDKMLRSLNPKLMVKIVDACNSGVQYIKAPLSWDKYLEKSRGRFESLYFIFSSLSHETSFADNQISFFTRALISVARTFASLDLRYTDLIEGLADWFVQRDGQTPYFVTQGSHLELFGTLPTQATEVLVLPDESGNTERLELDSPLNIVDVIRQDATRYATKEQAEEILICLKNQLLKWKPHRDLEALFSIKVDLSEELPNELPKLSQVACWLHDHDHDYMAKVKYRTRTVLRDDAWKFLGITKDLIEPHSVEVTAELPLQTLLLTCEPKYPNIDKIELRIVLLVSRIEVRFFYYVAPFHRQDWDVFRRSRGFTWQTIEAPIRDSQCLLETALGLLSNFERALLRSLADSFLGQSGSSEEHTREGQNSESTVVDVPAGTRQLLANKNWEHNQENRPS